MAATGFADALLTDYARAGGAPLGKLANIPPEIEGFRSGLPKTRDHEAEEAPGAKAPVM